MHQNFDETWLQSETEQEGNPVLDEIAVKGLVRGDVVVVRSAKADKDSVSLEQHVVPRVGDEGGRLRPAERENDYVESVSVEVIFDLQGRTGFLHVPPQLFSLSLIKVMNLQLVESELANVVGKRISEISAADKAAPLLHVNAALSSSCVLDLPRFPRRRNAPLRG